MKTKKFNYDGLTAREHYEQEEAERIYYQNHLAETYETQSGELMLVHAGLPTGNDLAGYSLDIIREMHRKYHATEMV